MTLHRFSTGEDIGAATQSVHNGTYCDWQSPEAYAPNRKPARVLAVPTVARPASPPFGSASPRNPETAPPPPARPSLTDPVSCPTPASLSQPRQARVSPRGPANPLPASTACAAPTPRWYASPPASAPLPWPPPTLAILQAQPGRAIPHKKRNGVFVRQCGWMCAFSLSLRLVHPIRTGTGYSHDFFVISCRYLNKFINCHRTIPAPSWFTNHPPGNRYSTSSVRRVPPFSASILCSCFQ